MTHTQNALLLLVCVPLTTDPLDLPNYMACSVELLGWLKSKTRSCYTLTVNYCGCALQVTTGPLDLPNCVACSAWRCLGVAKSCNECLLHTQNKLLGVCVSVTTSSLDLSNFVACSVLTALGVAKSRNKCVLQAQAK